MKNLLHICCAPCAVAIAQKLLLVPGMELHGYFYNPNIHPDEELRKRKDSVKAMSADLGIATVYDESIMQEYWKESLSGDKNRRCATCYSLRLDRVAGYAAENGFDAFTTSLLISPWQNHEMIKELAEKAAKKYDLQFYYEDFRNLYRPGREISRGKNWYMQKYCGCFFSYSESDHPKKPIYKM